MRRGGELGVRIVEAVFLAEVEVKTHLAVFRIKREIVITGCQKDRKFSNSLLKQPTTLFLTFATMPSHSILLTFYYVAAQL